MRIFRAVLAAVVWIAVAAHAADRQMVAQRDGTKVYSEPSMKSAVKTELPKGTAVMVFEEGGKGLFRKVRLTDGTEGFVAYIQLAEQASGSSTKVMNLVRQLVKPGDQPDDSARRRSAAAVMGIRGLAASKSEELDSVSNARPNLKAVYDMEERQVKAADLEKLSQEVARERRGKDNETE